MHCDAAGVSKQGLLFWFSNRGLDFSVGDAGFKYVSTLDLGDRTHDVAVPISRD